MNDEASSSSAPPPIASPDHDATVPAATAASDEVVHADKDAEEERSKIAAKKAANLKDVIRTFDMLVYAQLAAVYYMDTSLLRFLLRSFTQLLYLTPKPPMVPTPPNLKDRPYIGAIVGVNLFCLLLHLYLSHPSAGEATRGYLHGGLMIDFIGQKGPTSKLRLVLLDLAITALQMIMLAVTAEEKKAEKKGKRRRKSHRRQAQDASTSTSTDHIPHTTSETPATEETAQSTSQDHDAEEQGVRRSLESAPLLRNSNFAELDSPAANRELLDRLTSGQAITAKFYIVDAMRDEWRAYGEVSQSGATSAESLAAALSRSSSALRRMRGG
ncbi:DUF1746-domain-containing protein [Rhizodiscina lignyota]|uniref:DUF1746-domain-containing protein n=1 Tax=Rhizodiscina lignyota TaxID=1504668 RepID=A0A9P4M9N8_9PEZI|nr:DUF1746-domain-containing protein [Rhizodiscina lignyota]